VTEGGRALVTDSSQCSVTERWTKAFMAW